MRINAMSVAMKPTPKRRKMMTTRIIVVTPNQSIYAFLIIFRG